MSECVITAAEPVAGRLVSASSATDAGRDLLGLLAGVGDGRSGKGRDHPVAAVLALAAAATVAGMRGYTAIAGWVADVPTDMLADLYRRASASPAGPPSRSTIWRVLTDTDADTFDAVVGAWLMARRPADASAGTAPGDAGRAVLTQVRLDGKTVRGAKDTEGHQLHLLAALTGQAGPHATDTVVAAQATVPGAKPNETTVATAVLAHLDLSASVVTADALHTVKATAGYIHDHGGQFVLPVKENRRALFDALDVLPWTQTPIAHHSVVKGHGRITTRTIQVLPAPAHLPFPHVNQVWLTERYVTALDGTPTSAVAQLGITSLTTGQATPADLAGYIQGQWAIEVLHWIRDTCYREDNSTTRTRSGPRVMATLRNLAIGALRLAGRSDITEATRWACRHITRPFTILNLTPRS